MSEATSEPAARCPWCSAVLPEATAETCPACGATLGSADGAEPQLPGVTTLDAHAILRARSEVSRPRSRILSFITGEAEPDSDRPASPESYAPPSDDVRREMLRLQVEAELADLEAEQIALKADALSDIGVPLHELEAEERRRADVAIAGAVRAEEPAAEPTQDEPPAEQIVVDGPPAP